MPRRQDIKKILLVGSGPIVIGQACEFDYSGTQGAKALREEGYEVVLVNSNPATIMTDPQFSDRTYIEPLTPAVLEAIVEREKPQAMIATLGGQTALNLALALERKGVLKKHGVELLGAKVEAIEKAENRQLFKDAMQRIGVDCARAEVVQTLEQAQAAVETIGFPVILRPSFTLGGSGGGVAHNQEEFDRAIRWAFQQSPNHECLIEESLLGWKEFELEVIRDRADNFTVICTIENFDPMGVHTGDSITVAPAMTLTDREYQRMRDAGRAIIREIGVDTGGSNIQFAVNPANGRLIVIEMNPRVSRSSALASKATGYPIAKIAAKLAVGYTLDELRNDITGTSAAFEPAIDYVVCKIPRFAFEKFAGSDARLTTQMKSVGEAMAIGRCFQEALQKAARSLEVGRDGLVSLCDRIDYGDLAQQLSEEQLQGGLVQLKPGQSSAHMSQGQLKEALLRIIRVPLADRLWFVADALRAGASIDEVHGATAIDRWFLKQLQELIALENSLRSAQQDGFKTVARTSLLKEAKTLGFSDGQIAALWQGSAESIRQERKASQLQPIFSWVDTCAAEFAAQTPYMYSTWGQEDEIPEQSAKKVVILGGGPNRIGQGIEFDYCCVHASYALREAGYASVMVNCNPETVSTDYDTSTHLYFEPLTLEHVLNIIDREQPEGVIVQFGGQTPINLAVPLVQAGVKLLGTPAEAIDRAEDREKFDAIVEKLQLRRPEGGIARGSDEAFAIAERVGYPVVVRPSYVLGGRGMEVVHSPDELAQYFAVAFEAAREAQSQTILVDAFLRGAIEVDVDCIADDEQVIVTGVMQHIEEAGVHSGDSAVVLPSHALPLDVVAGIRSSTRALARELGIRGLMNVQFAVRGSEVYVIEVNPRASRTVPFVSKVTGMPLARIATQVMMGKRLRDLGYTRDPEVKHVAVKESVFPFAKFPGVDTILGPEMRSTGEVMGIASDFPQAYLKALMGSGTDMPTQGVAFVSVRDADKPSACELAARLAHHGFKIISTRGTAAALKRVGVAVEIVNKVNEGEPHIVDRIRAGEVDLVINTTEGADAIRDSRSLRWQTLISNVPYFTTMAAAAAAVAAIPIKVDQAMELRCLQEYGTAPRLT